MAHAAADLDTRRLCLENVLELNPGHTKAREKLNQLAPPPPAQQDSAFGFMMPADLQSTTDSGQPVPAWLGSAGSAPPFGSAPAPVSKATAKKDSSQTETRIGLALIVIALVLGAAGLVYKVIQSGALENLSGKPPEPGMVDGKSYVLHFPVEWDADCTSGLLRSSRICSFATEAQYGLLDEATRAADEVGNDTLVAAFNRKLFRNGQIPGVVISGLTADYKRSSKDYETVMQSINWYDQLYLQWHGQTNYLQGYDLWLQYDKSTPVINGQTASVYWVVGYDRTGTLLSGAGYLTTCDAFIPHGDRLMQISFIAYSPGSANTISKGQIEQIYQTVTFK
jgi:hypothetical protein